MSETLLPADARVYTTRDKNDWDAGPWMSEPDKVQWVDPATGLDCLLHRNQLGAWCGYVGIAEGHPYFEMHYNDVDAHVHGGLTYSAFCQDVRDECEGICHVPYPGRPERVWWLGFDCHHGGDFGPGGAAMMRKIRAQIAADYPYLAHVHDDEHYWTMAEVVAEVTSLAAQLRDAARDG